MYSLIRPSSARLEQRADQLEPVVGVLEQPAPGAPGAARSRPADGCRDRPARSPTARCPGRRRPRRASRASARVWDRPLNMPKNATFFCSCAKSSRNGSALGRIEDGPHELQDRLFVLGVRRDPAGVDLGLFERLEHEFADAPDEFLVDRARTARRRAGSGTAGTPRCGRAPRGPGRSAFLRPFRRVQRVSAVRHSRGSSDSTLMRARTSSLRLVSWVELASSVAGQSRARSALWRWKAVSERPNWSGSPPTSLSEIRRL